MQQCGFTFRADSGTTPKFELSSQPASPMALKFEIGATTTIGAPKGKRPINRPKSRVSRATLALQPKEDKKMTSFAAATTPLLVVDLPAVLPEETINSKTRLSRSGENLDIREQQTTLTAETKNAIDVPLPDSVSSRHGNQ